MANTRSAEKRQRQSERRRIRNTAVRTRVKSAVKQAREAVATKDPAKAKKALVEAQRIIDQASSKGVIHARNAARRIGRLATQIRTLGS